MQCAAVQKHDRDICPYFHQIPFPPPPKHPTPGRKFLRADLCLLKKYYNRNNIILEIVPAAGEQRICDGPVSLLPPPAAPPAPLWRGPGGAGWGRGDAAATLYIHQRPRKAQCPRATEKKKQTFGHQESAAFQLGSSSVVFTVPRRLLSGEQGHADCQRLILETCSFSRK